MQQESIQSSMFNVPQIYYWCDLTLNRSLESNSMLLLIGVMLLALICAGELGAQHSLERILNVTTMMIPRCATEVLLKRESWLTLCVRYGLQKESGSDNTIASVYRVNSGSLDQRSRQHSEY
jgi:hypothetical protein